VLLISKIILTPIWKPLPSNYHTQFPHQLFTCHFFILSSPSLNTSFPMTFLLPSLMDSCQWFSSLTSITQHDTAIYASFLLSFQQPQCHLLPHADSISFTYFLASSSHLTTGTPQDSILSPLLNCMFSQGRLNQVSSLHWYHNLGTSDPQIHLSSSDLSSSLHLSIGPAGNSS
jgi:hypothetical protein